MKRFSVILLCAVMVLCVSAASFAAAIHDAAAKGNLAKVKALVKKNPKLVSLGDKDGATPLHYAAAAGSKKVADFLISKKANVNARKKNGVIPLHVASALGKKDVCLLLINKKADVNATDNSGRTPLSVAQANNRQDVVDLLLALQAKTTETAQTSEQPKSDKEPADNLQGLAKELTGMLVDGKFDTLVNKFDGMLASSLPKDKLIGAWNGIITQAGPFQKIDNIRQERVEGFDCLFVTCQFEKGKIDVQLTFNENKQISGLFFLPPK